MRKIHAWTRVLNTRFNMALMIIKKKNPHQFYFTLEINPLAHFCRVVLVHSFFKVLCDLLTFVHNI